MKKSFVFVAVICVGASTALAGLEVYLPLDGNLNDASGKGRNGSLVSGPDGTNAFVPAQVGQGLDLGMVDESVAFLNEAKTTGDYVAINYRLPDTGSIAVWYKKFSIDYNYETVWDNSGSSTHPWDQWECWIDKNSKLWHRGADGEDGRWGTGEVTADRLSDIYLDGTHLDRWYHIAVTWEKTSSDKMAMDMYLDGELVSDNPDAWWQAPGNTFYLGGGSDGNTFGVGVWDELAIWSTRLDAGQVSNVYNDGVSAWEIIGLPGDLNGDGFVNSADLDIVRAAWGQSVSGGSADGDPNGDGVVNSADLDIVRANWGRTASAAVPEPTAFLLLLCGWTWVVIARRRR